MTQVIITLTPEQERRLWDLAHAQGVGLGDYLQNTIDALAKTTAPAPKPIWEVAIEIMQDVPTQELDGLPADASENLDHYLYGAPKRQS